MPDQVHRGIEYTAEIECGDGSRVFEEELFD
jgi:hypothetical protein